VAETIQHIAAALPTASITEAFKNLPFMHPKDAHLFHPASMPPAGIQAVFEAVHVSSDSD
jgi:hypothetical protein